jgi:hypothetical protein
VFRSVIDVSLLGWPLQPMAARSLVCGGRSYFTGLVSPRAAGPIGVVVDLTLFDEHFGLQQAAEDIAVEAFVVQLVVEAFDVAVFPRLAGPDIDRGDLIFLEPIPDRIGDKLRPVVTADVGGLAVARHGRFHHGDDVNDPDRLAYVDG